MSEELWRRARGIFERAVETPEPDRSRLLAQACSEDVELREAVESLLAADGETEGPLDRQRLRRAAEDIVEGSEDRWVGRSIGRYRIVRKLGEGGMGTVFLAERDDRTFEKQIALKLIRSDLDSDLLVSRFQNERQILANLEHPNIARLLDGGATGDGRPYLVMEYVEGAAITRYCDEAGLSLEDRLRLLRRVCSAVQYAHRNLVVHRDLKAGNILVTPEGEPKLLDFGIARMLDKMAGDGEPSATVTAHRMLTPDYASPEQIFGGPITTATDVYSLGVLLYELLAGRRPFAFQGRLPAEIEADLREGATPPGVDGDLDLIALKALRYEPERRYGSVDQLSEDLRRYLEGLPVEARPSSIAYRARKLVRRHAVAFTAGGAAVLMLLGFSILTALQSVRVTHERDLARREQAKSQEVTRFLIEAFEGVDPGRSRGREVRATEILENGALRITHELTDEPELRAALMSAIGRVYASLGLYDEAEPRLAESLKTHSRLFGPESVSVAESLHAWGELRLDQGKLEEAESSVRRSLAIRERGDPERVPEGLHLLARIRRTQGEREESVRLHEEALERQRRLGRERQPEYVEGLGNLATAFRTLGGYERAEELYRQALALQRELLPGDHPVTADLLNSLAIVFRRQDKLAEAQEAARPALEMSRRLYPGGHLTTARILNTLASVSRLQGRLKPAETLYRESLELRRGLLGPDHPRMAGAIHNLATLIHEDLGRPAEAEPLFREAVKIQSRALGEDHPNMAFYWLGLGRVLGDLEQSEEAETLLRRSHRVFEERGESRNAAMTQCALADLLLRTRRLAEAEELLTTGYPVLEQTYGNHHRITRKALASLVRLHRVTGRETEARKYEALLERGHERGQVPILEGPLL